MSEAYQTLVLQHYEKKKNENGLSPGLAQLSAAKLRKECFAAFANSSSREDKRIFINFFEESGDDEAALKRIRKRDASAFKALLNYLKGISKSTDLKNIELLAWLTDFDYRPFEFGKNYNSEVLKTDVITPEAIPNVGLNKDEEEERIDRTRENKTPEVKVVEEPLQVSDPIVDDNNIEKTDDAERKPMPVPSTLSDHKLRTNQKAMIATLAAVILAVGIFMYTKNGGKESGNLMGSTLNKAEGCMYWAGDHYQQVPCNQKMGETLVIALDTEKLNTFKKITMEDTITDKDIGRVWYIKHNNKIEFYTASGNYPLDLTQTLKPITEHIISAYIGTKP